MKCKVRLTYSVELYVEGKDEEEIQEWLNNTTPEGARSLACYQNNSVGNVSESYNEEIICPVREDSIVDYVIGR